MDALKNSTISFSRFLGFMPPIDDPQFLKNQDSEQFYINCFELVFKELLDKSLASLNSQILESGSFDQIAEKSKNLVMDKMHHYIYSLGSFEAYNAKSDQDLLQQIEKTQKMLSECNENIKRLSYFRYQDWIVRMQLSRRKSELLKQDVALSRFISMLSFLANAKNNISRADFSYALSVFLRQKFHPLKKTNQAFCSPKLGNTETRVSS